MSYESPIRFIDNSFEAVSNAVDDAIKQFGEDVDNLVIEACIHVGVSVDKDELEKALRYDRDQYFKGYEDGKRDTMPKRGEWKTRNDVAPYKPDGEITSWTYRCSVCGDLSRLKYNYCPSCGARMEVQE